MHRKNKLVNNRNTIASIRVKINPNIDRNFVELCSYDSYRRRCEDDFVVSICDYLHINRVRKRKLHLKFKTKDTMSYNFPIKNVTLTGGIKEMDS